MDANASTFVAEARKLLGIRFRHGGRTRFSLDCWGVIVTPLAAIGRCVSDDKVYSMGAWRPDIPSLLEAEFGPPVADKLAGDIVLIRWAKTAHMGILADHPDGGLSIIHMNNIHGVVEHRYIGPMLKATLVVYRPFKEHG